MTVKIATFFRCAASQLWQGCRAADKYTMTKPLCQVPYYSAEINWFAAKTCCKIVHPADLANPLKDIRDFTTNATELWRQQSFQGPELLAQCSACRVAPGAFSYKNFNHASFDHWGWSDTPDRASLRKLSVGLDNICASSCLPCGPHSSTSYGRLVDQHNLWSTNGIKTPGLKQLDLELLNGQLGDLEVVHLYGGEPLFSPNLARFCAMLKEQSPKLRTLSVSTGLHKINRRSLELLTDGPWQAHIAASIDAPLELNHWIRGISARELAESWQLIVELGDKIKVVGYQPTVGSFNVFAIPEYLNQIDQLNQQLAQPQPIRIISSPILNPETKSVWQLPQRVKDLVRDKLSKALNHSPSYGHELIRTGLELLDRPATQTWYDCSQQMEQLTAARGDARTFNYWFKQYFNWDAIGIK